jgi:hypothetical protein
MRIDVNGTRLWFDVDGPALVPEGTEMRLRPTVVLVHGGPGVYDHSYFKPDFTKGSRSSKSSTAGATSRGWMRRTDSGR